LDLETIRYTATQNLYTKDGLDVLNECKRVGDEENDEAEAMIRAITHGEIDNQVYSKMADDLEKAAQIKRKAEKPKKKKKKKTNAASTSSASELATSASEVSVK